MATSEVELSMVRDVESGEKSVQLSELQGGRLEVRNLTISTLDDSPKTILHPLSFYAAPGEVLAVMGPSGSGKTTTLSALARRSEGVKVRGEVLLNGCRLTKRLGRRVSLVPQDSAMRAALTVEETLSYVAALRIDAPEEERRRRVSEVIAALKLESCRDTRVGDGARRGISGGEKKRLAVGEELLSNPPVLLLDECTSGLDAASASRMLGLLHDLAAKGRTVVTTIHQPNSSMFRKFDRLLVLARGRVLFFGPTAEAVSWFAANEVPCPPLTNPADFILDIATDESIFPRIADAWNAKEGKGKQTTGASGRMEGEGSGKGEGGEEEVKQEEEAEVEEEDEEEEEDGLAGDGVERKKWEVGFWMQLAVLSHRALKTGTDAATRSVSLTQSAIVATICGLLWFRGDLNSVVAEDRLGMIFFSTVYISITAAFEALTKLPSERLVVRRERSSGLYRLSALYLAYSFSLLPYLFLLPSLYLLFLGPLAGLRLTASGVFGWWGGIILTCFCTQGLGLAISSWLVNLERAIVFMVCWVLLCMLSGGFYASEVPEWLSWISKLSFVSYAYPLIASVEFPADEKIPCPEGNIQAGDTSISCPTNGDTIYQLTRPIFQEQWANILMLLAQSIFFRIIAYWGLRVNA